MGSAGRGQQKTTAGAGENNIASGQGILGNATNVANSEVNTSGGLSPLVGKQLANEEGQIGRAYQGATQAALEGQYAARDGCRAERSYGQRRKHRDQQCRSGPNRGDRKCLRDAEHPQQHSVRPTYQRPQCGERLRKRVNRRQHRPQQHADNCGTNFRWPARSR